MKPEIIPLALAPETHRLLQIVFRYFWRKIRETATAPGFVPKQLGGGASTRRKRSKRRSSRRVYVKSR